MGFGISLYAKIYNRESLHDENEHPRRLMLIKNPLNCSPNLKNYIEADEQINESFNWLSIFSEANNKQKGSNG